MVTGKESGIAEWRVEDPAESLLAELADSDWGARKSYVEFYRRRDPEYFERGVDFIGATLERFGVEPGDVGMAREDLIVDMVYSLHRFGFSFEEYLWYGLWGLNREGRGRFIPDKLRYAFYSELNRGAESRLFSDKSRTYDVFGRFFGRRCLEVRGRESAGSVREICERGGVIAKPVSGCCGRGARVFENPDPDELIGYAEKCGGAIIEELIIQSPDIAVFHPSSVNTVRVPTIIGDDGKCHIFDCFFRMGAGGSRVDNAGAGGVFCNVDPDSGICSTCGVDESGGAYLRHPDSGKVIPGFSLPDWDDARDLVERLALIARERGYRYVGWDLAHTDDGWVLVEGNSLAQFLMQIPDRVGRLEKLLQICPSLRRLIPWE